MHDIPSYPDPEYEKILYREVKQQLQLEDLIAHKLIYIGQNGDELYFLF